MLASNVWLSFQVKTRRQDAIHPVVKAKRRSGGAVKAGREGSATRVPPPPPPRHTSPPHPTPTTCTVLVYKHDVIPRVAIILCCAFQHFFDDSGSSSTGLLYVSEHKRSDTVDI